MGLYKLCKHKGRARDRCGDAWWGSFQYKGRLYRESLGRWSDQAVPTKAAADVVFDRMKDAIRAGTLQMKKRSTDPMTFEKFGDIYIERHVKLKGLRSGDEIGLRIAVLKKRWKGKALTAIRVGEVEDLVQDLKAKGRRPATCNRYLALLRHMFNWAVGREYLDSTPFRRGSHALIKLEREDNRRTRRVSLEEEANLRKAATPLLNALIVAALDTGMRRGELLTLQFSDIDFERQTIHVRGENAKSKKGRSIPIGTTRLKAMLDWLRLDAAGEQKPADAFAFSDGAGERVKGFRREWEHVLEATGSENL